MTSKERLLTIKEASEWATDHIGKEDLQNEAMERIDTPNFYGNDINMNITGKITGIKYKVLLAETLKTVDVGDFNGFDMRIRI